MRILVTGASGMVGSAIRCVFAEHELDLTDISTLDVRDYGAVIERKRKPCDLIIHLAAETDLEKCERSPEHAYYTNYVGTMNMAILAEHLDIPIVYISTAGVFDGRQDSYNEWDIPNPLNHYGRSKLYGESVFGEKYWIFRAGWMMGGGAGKDKKFVYKIIKQLNAGKQTLYALKDVYGSPTYAVDLARTILGVIEAKAPYGLYHCAGVGRASRFEVAKSIAHIMGKDVKLVPVTRGYFSKDFFCPRAQSEVLENVKLRSMGLCKMQGWRDSLKHYLQTEFAYA